MHRNRTNNKYIISIALCLALSFVPVLALTGCGKSQKTTQIFSCDSDNLLGISGIYETNGDVTIELDCDALDDLGDLNTFAYVQKKQKFPKNIRMYFYYYDDGDDEYYKVDMNDVSVKKEGKKLLITIETTGFDPKDMYQFAYDAGTPYYLNIEKGSIYLNMMGGECGTEYYQYLEEDGYNWGEPEEIFSLYPIVEE